LDWSEAKGSTANDGFTTELIAVKGKSNISGKNQDFSFMVKMTPETGHRVNMVKEMGLFVKEYVFYNDILPKLEIERKERCLEKLSIPKCFHAHPDPGVLVMKNLKDDGFEMVKNKSTDDNIILFLKSLASLHASTYHLMEQTGLTNVLQKKLH